jgi:hypothetical protein
MGKASLRPHVALGNRVLPTPESTNFMRYVLILLAAASLVACSDAAVNSGDYVEVRFVNSTGLSNVVVAMRDSIRSERNLKFANGELCGGSAP